MKLNLFLILLFLWGITSCVGTVKDNAKVTEQTYKGSPTTIYFDGIASAVATAHTKVQVSFRPASGGSGSFSYQIYINGNYAVPVASVSPSNLQIDANGYINTTVNDLKIGQLYAFTVKAYDNLFEVQDTNTLELSATTLSYLVPLFNGISSLENIAGISGKTQLLAKWSPATPAALSSDPFSVNPHDISGYNIYVGTNLTNLTLYGSVPSSETQYLITGLLEGQDYVVRVRAKNSATPRLEELNVLSLDKRTKTDAPISFDGIKTATVPSTSAGFNTINISWNPGNGNFDRYKIYASTTPMASFNPGVDASFGSDIVSLSTTSLTLTVGIPNTTYYLAVVACNGPTCSTFAGQGKVITVKTSPPVAPFNGISQIIQPAGEDGLSSVDLVWEAPAISAGVYDYVKIFSTDSSGNYDPATDELPIYSSGSPSIMGRDASLTTSTGTRIKGMANGVENCFIAEAYSVNPFDPLFPNGRSTNSKKKVCATAQYSYPSFTGIKNNCTNVQGTSFTIGWNTPSPAGIFSNFEIYYRVGSSGFNIADAMAGAPGYTKTLASVTDVSNQISGLAPSSTFQVAMKTYFKHPVTDEVFRDSNQNVATCSTSSAQVVHPGWKEIFAIGPKINGLTNTPIIERLRTASDTNFHGVMPMEDSTASPGVTGSTQGIVSLVWDDFALTGGLGNMRAYPGASNGYRVYRKVYTSVHDFLPPTIDDADWGNPVSGYLSSTPILDVNTSQFRHEVRFIDYTVQQSGVADEPRIYWYKVEAFLNGFKIDYSSIVSDSVVKVILPLKNQALVHRWMVNRQMCGMIGKTSSRADHYRCAYNGLASKNGFFDTGAHFLSDRFEMGCKFSRGDDPDPQKKCTDTSGTNSQFLGGSTIPAQGIKAGDCVMQGGALPNFTGISAKKGSVAYVRPFYTRWGGCWVNTSASGYGSTWEHLNNLEIGSPFTPDQSTFPINTSSTPQGQSKAKEYVSTDSKLGPVFHLNQYNSSNLCKGFKVEIQKNVTDRLLIKRRLPARAEFNWMGLPPTDLLDATLKKVNDGKFVIGTQLRACNTYNPIDATRPAGGTALDLIYDNWPSHATDTGSSARFSVRATGSSGASINASGNAVASTDYCHSKYGIQDLKGNANEWMADQYTQVANTGISVKWKDPGAQTIPFIQFEPEVLDYWKNGDGTYFEMLANSNRYLPNLNFAEFFTPTAIDYVNPIVGLPLECGGGLCGGASDDNVLVTPKSTSPSPSTTIFNARWMGSTFGNSFNLWVTTHATYLQVGMYNNSYTWPDNGPWGGTSAGFAASAPFTYATYLNYQNTATTMNVGFRCIAKIKEDNDGKFMP